MVLCDRCGIGIDTEEEYVDLAHHHPHLTFDSRFCSVDCTIGYLEDGLLEGG
jgi:hypothetical protein